MYIKAKYNNLIRPYMRTVKQGFGSLYGGNQTSDITNEERLDTLNTSNNSFDSQNNVSNITSTIDLSNVNNDQNSIVNKSQSPEGIIYNTNEARIINPPASYPINEEEAGNDIVNGRLNENADGYVLSQPDWSWVDGAIQYDGTGESYFGVQKTRSGAVGMSSVNQILRFEVLAGEFYFNFNAIDNNMNVTQGTFGVGVHELNPLQMLNFGGTEPTIYFRTNTTGSRIDNIFLQPAE